ncbi:MAG: outer membrane protein transport protein [Campylobacterota bacterium]|nr:outer membrane protein transport protein [Campylobacterota bacterium]
MKKDTKLALSAIALLTSTSAFATNGTNLIGYSAEQRGMGGAGIAITHGAESGLVNPALIRGSEGMIGGTYFSPTVEFKNSVVGMPANGYAKSDADANIIPVVAMSHQVTENFAWGISMFGSAGMGVDYRDQTKVGDPSQTQGMQTNLQLMKFSVPISYNTNGFSVGVAPVIQYGTLAIAYSAAGAPSGVSQDLGYGFELGAGYDMGFVSFGAIYKSAIAMEYKDQISTATRSFGVNNGLGFGDHLDQPAEYGLGVAFNLGGNTLALDYKQIAWGSAKGYKDFNWENQNVYSLGYEYQATSWAVRAGYNYSPSPVKEMAAGSMMGTGQYDGAVINYFNMAGFPAIIEQHFTIGGGYDFSDKIGIDIAYVYSPKATESFNTSAMTQAMAMQAGAPAAQAMGMTSSASAEHSQYGLTADIHFKF